MSVINETEIVEFTKNLKFLRQSAGWTQEELAKKVGVTRQTITAIETNKIIPSTTLFLALAGLFIIGSSINPIMRSVSETLNINNIFELVPNAVEFE
jgi:putative transcriptional regulator